MTAPRPLREARGYVRVSDERQAADDRVSLGDQRRAIEELAERLGARVVEWYEEHLSGGTAEGRPAFSRLIADCEAAARRGRDAVAGLVLALDDSRFGRFDDVEEGTYWRHHLARQGWVVRYAVGDDMREQSPERAFVRLAGQMQATGERQRIKRRAKTGHHGTAAQGFWITRAPVGYRRKTVHPSGRSRVLERGERKALDERVVLVPHETEAAVVRAMFAKYATGEHSLTSLTEWLLAHHPVRAWSKASVREILKNPVYVGDVVTGRVPADKKERAARPRRDAAEWTVKESAHPALVERALFAAVQAKLAGNKRRTRAVRSAYVLSGLVHCRCGRHLTGSAGRIPSYACVTRGKHPSARCPYPGNVSQEALDRAVVGEIAAVVGSPAARRRLAQLLDDALEAVRDGARRGTTADKARARVRKIAERRQRLVAAIEDGALTTAEAQERMAALRAELVEAEAALRVAEADTDGRAALATTVAERERLLAILADFPAAVARLQAAGATPALKSLIRPWLARAEFDTETRIVTLDIRHLPAGLAAGDDDRDSDGRGTRSFCGS